VTEKTYGRWTTDARGKSTKRFVAIEPADKAVTCTCGRPDCHRAKLLPFREHIAELYRTIWQLNDEQLHVSESCDWSSVLYGLRMAASIDDVEADTGYVEDALVFALCEPSIDYERGQSEMASKYVAAASIFNFLWLAYEAAVGATAPGELRRLAREARLGERGRRLLEARPEMSARFRGVNDLANLALLHCRKGGLMLDRCARIEQRFADQGLVTAAELCREFRNFLYHGEDEVPHHEDWGDPVTSRCRIFRFYSVSRLVLYLIQAMCWIAVEGGDRVVEHDAGSEDLTAREVLQRLQFR
jgi:hypothetical protein